MPRMFARSESLVLALILIVSAAPEGRAQAAPPSATAMSPSRNALDDPFEPETLGAGPYQEMSTLLEVTVFRIDIFTLTVRLGRESGARLRSIAEGANYGEELADSVAAVVLSADEAWARQRFQRDVGFDRLVEGMRENAGQAAEAGFISREYAEEFSDSLPEWFGFLAEAGAAEGDEIVFRIRGDTLRTLYRTKDGRILLDRTVAGAQERRASIPSFFAPGTRFRRGLVESLLASRPND